MKLVKLKMCLQNVQLLKSLNFNHYIFGNQCIIYTNDNGNVSVDSTT